jgi:hypothetical protein
VISPVSGQFTGRHRRDPKVGDKREEVDVGEDECEETVVRWTQLMSFDPEDTHGDQGDDEIAHRLARGAQDYPSPAVQSTDPRHQAARLGVSKSPNVGSESAILDEIATLK